MPYPRRFRHAFTLIEMSIVLVIIGLIVGGTLAMRGYLRNAELTTVMNEAKYYANQFNQFQSLYNMVPGDGINASSYWSVTNGDGNGLVNAGLLTDEVFYAFQHLAAAGLISGSYSGGTAGGGGTHDAKIGTNVPVSDVFGITFLFDHPNQLDGVVSGDSFYQDGVYGNILRIAAHPTTGTGFPGTPFLTPKQAYQLDLKFDDGNATTGMLTVPKGLTHCTSGTLYDTGVANADYVGCWFIMNMR